MVNATTNPPPGVYSHKVNIVCVRVKFIHGRHYFGNLYEGEFCIPVLYNYFIRNKIQGT